MEEYEIQGAFCNSPRHYKKLFGKLAEQHSVSELEFCH